MAVPNYYPDELAIIIWDSEPTDHDTLVELAEVDFDKEAFDYYSWNNAPDLTNNFVFAAKGPVQKFIKALVKTIDGLPLLPNDDDGDYDNWGYNYNVDNYNLLKKIGFK